MTTLFRWENHGTAGFVACLLTYRWRCTTYGLFKVLTWIGPLTGWKASTVITPLNKKKKSNSSKKKGCHHKCLQGFFTQGPRFWCHSYWEVHQKSGHQRHVWLDSNCHGFPFGRFHKWGIPKMIGSWWKIPLRWMIWGYPYFRNPPCILLCFFWVMLWWLQLADHRDLLLDGFNLEMNMRSSS